MSFAHPTSDVAMEELERFLIDAIQIMLGARPSTRSHVVICEDQCISVKYVSVAHPRANGQVERANDMILDALKKRLYQKEKKHLSR